MLLFSYSLVSLLAISFGAQQVPLANPTSPFTASFDKLVTQSLDRWHTPGLAISVVHGEDTFSKGYGIATFPDKPVTPDTLFYTASTTKSFTAAAISLLIDHSVNSSEKLSWRAPLAEVIREDFVLADEYTTVHATIEDALSHRTGMPRHDLSYGEANFTVRDVVQNLRRLPMTAEIRTRFQYCNMMYIAVSHFIETWTGMWLGDFLRARIYEPLSMTSTFFTLSDAQEAAASGGPSLATPYYWTNRSKTYHSVPYLDASHHSGCGAMISNVLDYSKWLRCMMTMASPFSPAGHRALRLPRTIVGPSPEESEESTGFRGSDDYALGWTVSNYRGEVLYWHPGVLPGFRTIMMYFPRLQWGVTIMANGETGDAIQVLVFKLIDDILGIPEQDRFDWAPVLERSQLRELERLKNAKKLMYPNAPKEKDAIPLILPLESYAGTYTNDGYPPLTLTNNGTASSRTFSPSHQALHCVLQYDQYPISMSFQHISGEYFLVFVRWYSTEPRTTTDEFILEADSISKAEFRLGEDGRVKEMGILLEPEMGDAHIWFKKTGAENGDGYGKDIKAGLSAIRREEIRGVSGVGEERRLFSRTGPALRPLFG